MPLRELTMQNSADETSNPAISGKTGAAKKAGDDAQNNAADRVRAGTPPGALPVIERKDDNQEPRDSA
jgi:hypothetical protein